MSKINTLLKQNNDYLIQNYKRFDISFVSGKNSTLKDIDGKKYIDFASGIGVCSLGHSNKAIIKTITKQSNKLLHTSNLFHIKPQIKLAKKINQLIKPAMKNAKSFFCNSGAEANEAAIKIARKYGNNQNANMLNKHQKYEIITLKNSFHGRTCATLKACGQSGMHIDSFAPYIDGFRYANNIEDIYNKITPKTCAVMIELIKGEGGLKAHSIKQIQKLSKFLKKQDILLICDEVQSGVYRAGEFVCAINYGIKADIITLAKGLGGGVGIGAVVTNIKDAFSYGEHGSTFGGNFLSVSVANSVLDELEKLKNSSAIDKTIKLFDNELNKILQKYPQIFASSSGMGLMRGLIINDTANEHIANKNKDYSINDVLNDILRLALKNNLILLRSGKNVVRFLPPINIKEKEIKKGFKNLNQAVQALTS